jgi:hypothetical protein
MTENAGPLGNTEPVAATGDDRVADPRVTEGGQDQRIAPPSLLRFEAPHFVAAVECRDGMVVGAAPILRYMLGWTCSRAQSYAAMKGWK